jgi:hypothetical protein
MALIKDDTLEYIRILPGSVDERNNMVTIRWYAKKAHRNQYEAAPDDFQFKYYQPLTMQLHIPNLPDLLDIPTGTEKIGIKKTAQAYIGMKQLEQFAIGYTDD